MSPRSELVHQRYLDLLDRIEARFAVADWRCGDIDLWPPARISLFLDLFKASGADSARPAPPFAQRAAEGLAAPLTNAWKSRRDLAHWRPRPTRADAIVLGDGVSLDKADGAWLDRHGEPVIAALEQDGHTAFLMQPGGLDRLPFKRPTFAANTVAAGAALDAAFGPKPALDLPDHAAVLDLLEQEGFQAPSFAVALLAKRAHAIAAAAARFQRILHAVRPRLAFVVTYYAGLGHAFVLACRREGVMCVDLQHCPQGGAHRAYRWRSLPDEGYSTLPAVFWTWTPEEADKVAAWASPWHSSVYGGHSQLAAFLDDPHPATRAWDDWFAAVGDPSAFEREILVALQPIGGRRAVWEALARQIEAGPSTWRWWIRRHPTSTPFQDAEYPPLLALERTNIVIAQASALPLPALLRHMSVVVSLASGTATEAASFGVPALFVDEEALALFPGLIEGGQATLIDLQDVTSRIAALPARPAVAARSGPPPIGETLRRLDLMADDYARLCRGAPVRGVSPIS